MELLPLAPSFSPRTLRTMEGQEAIEEMVKTVKPKATWAIKGAEAWEDHGKKLQNWGETMGKCRISMGFNEN